MQVPEVKKVGDVGETGGFDREKRAQREEIRIREEGKFSEWNGGGFFIVPPLLTQREFNLYFRLMPHSFILFSRVL
jgi:hypothetical protein